MIGKAWKYKGLDFTDAIQIASQMSNNYSYILQDINMNVPLRTNTYDRENYHWWFSSNTLAGSRLFTFKWLIIWVKKSDRDKARQLLMSQLQPEGNPNIQNRWFYDLSWQTDWWALRTCKAKVFSMPQATNDLGSPIINFTFELYTETEKIYSPTTQVITWWLGYHWGISIPLPLPTYLSWYAWYVNIMNNWDWTAPCRIEVNGICTNPQIINLTNNNKYRIAWNTNDLVLDNRNMNNNPLEIFLVTDNWLNIKDKRSSGADIFLDPWLNHIVVLTDNPSETATVSITFRYTYIQ